MKKLFKVKLHGTLQTNYTEDFIEVYAKDLQEVFSNLCGRFGEGFKSTILEGAWHITKGSRETNELASSDLFVAEQEVTLPIKENELHVFPAIVGAGGKGVGQIILGVVLIIIAVVVALYNPVAGGFLATLASGGFATAALVAGIVAIGSGVISLLTAPPEIDSFGTGNGADPKQGFIFNGPINNTEEGVAVPIVCGEHLAGSTIISAGIETIQL